MELIRYVACSAAALAVDSSLYWMAMDVGAAYQVAAVIGFVGGVSTAYVLSVRWAFRRRSVENPHLEFLIFLGIGVVGLGLTEGLLWLLIDVLELGAVSAKLIASAGVFAFNFSGRKFVLFTQRTIVARAVT